jgi:hypothetical protein
MKKLIIIFLMLSVGLLNAQTDKNYILRTNFGYSYSHKDRLDAGNGFASSGYYGQINHDFTVDFRAGRRLKSNFYYGFGFSYNALKQEINPEEDIPDFSSSSGYIIHIENYFQGVSTSRTYSPVLFFQYYYNISDRFSVNLDAYSRYDFSISKSESNYYTLQYIDSTFVITNSSYLESTKQYLSFGINPSLRYSIVKNLGMEFVFGSLEYKQKLSESRMLDDERNSNEFIFGFKPENWLIGFYLEL